MAITLYPFIIATKKERENEILMHHERIHLVQEKELWILPFYILYLGHSFWLLLTTFSFRKCYYANVFEAEAYAHEYHLNYLDTRPKFQSLKKDDLAAIFRDRVLSEKSDWKDRLAAFGILLGVFSALAGLITYLVL